MPFCVKYRYSLYRFPNSTLSGTYPTSNPPQLDWEYFSFPPVIELTSLGIDKYYIKSLVNVNILWNTNLQGYNFCQVVDNLDLRKIIIFWNAQGSLWWELRFIAYAKTIQMINCLASPWNYLTVGKLVRYGREKANWILLNVTRLCRGKMYPNLRKESCEAEPNWLLMKSWTSILWISLAGFIHGLSQNGFLMLT